MRRWGWMAAVLAVLVAACGLFVRVSAAPAARSGRAATLEASRNQPAPLSSSAIARLGALPAGDVAAFHTLVVGGLARWYLTIGPRDASGRLPVVLLLHGRHMTPMGMWRLTRLGHASSPAVFVLPAGWQQYWNAGGCCGPAAARSVDDVGFVRAAVGQVLHADPAADPRRVYAFGFSNGGRLAFRLACAAPGLLAGFLAAEAVPVEPCPAMHPVDVVVVAQQSDPLLTVASGRPKRVGGRVEPTVTAEVSALVRLDRCGGPPSVTRAGAAVERTWRCAAGTSLRYVWYPRGGHTWRRAAPGTPGATALALQMVG